MSHTSQQYTIEDFLQVKYAGSPQYNPDGTHIAFLSNEAGVAQIYRTAIAGGPVVQLTDFPDAISELKYSPTEERIVFAMSKGGSERDQLYMLDVLNKEVRALTDAPTVKHSLGFFSADGNYLSYASTERNGKDFDVYVLDVRTVQSRLVFAQGDWCAARMFSPSGRYLAVDRLYHNENADVYICDLETGSIACVTEHDGDVFYEAVGWAADEDLFFLASNFGREYVGLFGYSMAKRQMDLMVDAPGDLDVVALDPVHNRAAVVVNEGGYSVGCMYDISGMKQLPYVLPRGQVSAVHFSPDGTALAFTWMDARHAENVYVMQLLQGAITQVTQSAQGVPPEVLSDPELVSFTSFDGLTVPAFVYAPKDGKEGKPVIISIHGGPAMQHRPMLLLLVQYFVYAGYVVVAPNVRGSTGYGKTFAALDNVEKRLDSVKDIIALREYLIATDPGLDMQRCVVMGGSYGGFMVLACLAFYPDLWAAGVDIVGIANFVTFLENTADYRRANREAEYGTLAHHRPLLEQISPIHAAGNIRAPLFVVHGANDPRVPLSETQQMVEKMKSHGLRVDLLVYEDEGHGLVKLQNKLDAYPKMVAFLDEVLSARSRME